MKKPTFSAVLSLIASAILFCPAAAEGAGCTPVTSSANLTANTIPMATNTCAIDNSGVTTYSGGTMITTSASLNAGSLNLLPPTYTTTPPNGIGLVSVTLLNSSGGAPAVNQLACWDPSVPATVTACNASTGKTSVAGVAFSNAVSVGSLVYSQIVRMGAVNCVFDTATTAGHYVTLTASTTTPSKCHDAGLSYPTSGQVVGIALSGGPAGTYQLFAMNDLPTAGLVPVAAAPTTTVDGSIAYNSTDQLYQFGETILGGPVYPVTLMPTTIVPLTTQIVCSHGISGCVNPSTDDVAGNGPYGFNSSFYLFPGNFFSLPGRTVRSTYVMSMATSSSAPSMEFYYSLLNPTGSPTPLYASCPLSSCLAPLAVYSPPFNLGAGGSHPPAAIIQAVCTATVTSVTPLASGALLGNCTISAPGATSLSFSNSVPQPVASLDLTVAHRLNFQVLWSGSTGVAGNTLTLLSATTEVLQ